jgi:4-amino-4-deoxy-L-arabinose transferase-like glycosyltransferase
MDARMSGAALSTAGSRAVRRLGGALDTSRSARVPLSVAAAVLAATLGILLWNAAQYPWLKGPDAYASWQYTRVVTDGHRLPTTADTDVWHNPPLFFAVAGQIERAARHVGFTTPEHAVQLLSAFCVFGIVLFSGLIARALFPSRPWLWVAALVIAALTPVLIRAGSLYHPEPLATFLATAALFVIVRALAHGGPSWKTGLVAGLLLALANLTRTWALATAAAVVLGLLLAELARRDRQALLAAGTVVAVMAVLAGPWFAYKAIEHGSPLAYSQPNPEQWRKHGRPLAFWADPALHDLFTRPYFSAFRNHLVPVTYADWWGDYWRSYRVPPELHDDQGQLPGEYAGPLVRQVWLGLWISIATLAGVVALTIGSIRRRDAALGTMLLSLGFLAVSYAGFLWRYPKQDGDNIKALYVLNAVPVVALAAGYAIERLGSEGVLLRAGVILATLLAVLSTLAFVLLPHA